MGWWLTLIVFACQGRSSQVPGPCTALTAAHNHCTRGLGANGSPASVRLRVMVNAGPHSRWASAKMRRWLVSAAVSMPKRSAIANGMIDGVGGTGPRLFASAPGTTTWAKRRPIAREIGVSTTSGSVGETGSKLLSSKVALTQSVKPLKSRLMSWLDLSHCGSRSNIRSARKTAEALRSLSLAEGSSEMFIAVPKCFSHCASVALGPSAKGLSRIAMVCQRCVARCSCTAFKPRRPRQCASRTSIHAVSEVGSLVRLSQSSRASASAPLAAARNSAMTVAAAGVVDKRQPVSSFTLRPCRSSSARTRRTSCLSTVATATGR